MNLVASKNHFGVNDPLYLSSSDNLRLLITNIMFNGSNFLAWSRSIRLALRAKAKLRFITSDYPKPDEGDSFEYQR